jgi:hypothetical protein
MRKLWRFHRGPADQDRAQFQRWFLDEAAPLVAAIPSLNGYVVNVFDLAPKDPTLRFLPPGSPSRAGTLVYDVAEEIWSAEPDIAPHVRGLDARTERCDQFEVVEHVRFESEGSWGTPGSRGGLKQIPMVVWRDDICADQAHALWAAHAATVRRVHPSADRYTQNWVIRALSDDAPLINGIGALYYPSLSAFETTFHGDMDGYRAVQADAIEFIAAIPGRLFATEHLFKAPGR